MKKYWEVRSYETNWAIFDLTTQDYVRHDSKVVTYLDKKEVLNIVRHWNNSFSSIWGL